MAYHAGAELTNIECFQVNPLLKDYNGPACAYVSGPFGGYTVNAKGNRFMLSDYWSGQMMWEFYRELYSANGPVYLKMDHLAPETVDEIEQILHTTERPSRGRFHAGRGVSYGSDLIEMSISEIGLCSGHSASGVWVNERGKRRCRACMPRGTWPLSRTATCSAPSPAGEMLLSSSAPLGTRGSMTGILRRSKGECFVRCRSRTAFRPISLNISCAVM